VNFDNESIGNSSVWDSTGRILLDVSEREQAFAAMEPLNLPENQPFAVNCSDLPARYLSWKYYFIQLP
jgi:hypothetical protein